MISTAMPMGWAQVRLGDVTQISKNRILPENIGSQNYIGLENIERDTHRILGLGESLAVTSIKSVFRAGNLLYGRLRPNLNKLAIPNFDGACSTDIIVFQTTGLLDVRYLLHIFSDEKFLAYSVSKAKGVNLPRISTADILSYEIALPPIEEQLEIIDALDSKLSQIEATRHRLVTFEQIIGRLPSKIIDQALSAKLGASFPPDVETASSFGWTIKSLVSLGEITLGKKRSLKNHQGPNMRPYLRVANVLEAKIDTSDIMSMHFEENELKIYRLEMGDILLNEGQSLELVGRPAMFNGEIEECYFTNTLLRFRAGPEMNPDFALLVFRHYLYTGVFSEIAKITTNLAHLGLGRFSSLPFPVPPIAEQQKIANWVKSRLDNVEQLALIIDRLRKISARLVTVLRTDALSGSMIPSSGVYDVSDRLRHVDLSANEEIGRGPRAPKPNRTSKIMTLSILEALARSRSDPTGQELFELSGYPDDSPIDVIERFFLELRDGLATGAITRREAEGEDRFRLGEKEVSA